MNTLLRRLAAALALTTAAASASAQNAFVADRPDRSHIVFGYTQSNDPAGAMQQYRWNALTHVGYTFVDFNVDGDLIPGHVTTFNNRASELKYGGTAEMNGVKVVAVVRNNNFDTTVLNTVLTSQTLRQNLADQIVALVSNPATGCDGVSMDFEPTWGTTTRTGITAFLQDLYPKLKALSPARELSVYVHPTYSSSYYNVPAVRDFMDYMIYSGYDFGTGGSVSAIGRYAGTTAGASSIIKNCNDWINAGMPASRMVIALPTYGRTWDTDTPTYGSGAGFNAFSTSWVDANYNTNGRQPPYTKNLSSPVQHQGRWYAVPTGGSYSHRVTTFDDPDTLEIKMDLARDWKGLTNTGEELAGVAFWSLWWVGQGNAPGSVDPNDPTDTVDTSLIRTHSQPWTLWEEMFSPPAAPEFRAETFEVTSLNPRWVDPNSSPDSVALNASAAVSSVAAPAGAPGGKARAAAVTFSFSSAVNRMLFKFQTLAGKTPPYALDPSSSLVLVDKNTQFMTDLHVPAAYAGTTIRMVVRDGDGELEKSPPFPLASSGWRRISWNLTTPSDVSAYATAEGGFLSGDGVLDSAGGDARDVAFFGFEVVSASANSGTINFGQIVYADVPAQELVIDKAVYDAETTMTVTLFDSDLAGDGTAAVNAASTLEAAGESVILTETAAPGVFTGELFLHYHRLLPADGKLQTQPGDTLTVTYANADDGAGSPSVLTQTASVRTPEIILESRESGGALTSALYYEESAGPNVWAHTIAKSIAPGLAAPGGRYTGDLSNGAWAKFKPAVTLRGYYDVYITLPGNNPASPTRGFYSFSPGAEYLIQSGSQSASGVFDLSLDNPEIADTWYLLASGIYFDPAAASFIQITNRNAASSGTQRFGMDAVKLTLTASDPVPVSLTSFSLE